MYMKQGIFHFVDEEKRPNKFCIYRDLEVVECCAPKTN